MSQQKQAAACCSPRRSAGGFWSGVLSGIIPHSFCILFIVLTLIGSVAGASFARKFLLIPHFLAFLVFFSVALATLAAWLYLRRQACCSSRGLKSHWRYLLILYGTTLIVNVAFIYVVFPALTKAASAPVVAAPAASQFSIVVDIPCSGHASLIISELKTVPGVLGVAYQPLKKFQISYDPALTNPTAILSLAIFKTYPAQLL